MNNTDAINNGLCNWWLGLAIHDGHINNLEDSTKMRAKEFGITGITLEPYTRRFLPGVCRIITGND